MEIKDVIGQAFEVGLPLGMFSMVAWLLGYGVGSVLEAFTKVCK